MYLLLLLLFFLLSVLLAGIKVAFVSAVRLPMVLRKKRKSKSSALLARLLEQPQRFLQSIQWGYYFFLSLFIGALLLFLTARRYSTFSSLGFYLIIGISILWIAEMLMKTFCRARPEAMVYFLAYPAYCFYGLFVIPAQFTLSLSSLILSLFFSKQTNVTAPAHSIQLENYMSTDQSALEVRNVDTKLFTNVLNLRQLRARDCMVPRQEIVHLDADASLQDLEQLFQQTGLSRILIIEKELDDVLGYVHHQQLLRQPESLRSIVMDLNFVPEVMNGIALLNKFMDERINISGVVDEFGMVKGVITLEDIIEKLFGEIDDEHDEETHLEVKLSDNTYLFSGRLEIDHLNDKYPNLHFPKGNYRTLSGYLVMTTEIIPKQGDEITLGNCLFILESVTETKIETVRVIQMQ